MKPSDSEIAAAFCTTHSCSPSRRLRRHQRLLYGKAVESLLSVLKSPPARRVSPWVPVGGTRLWLFLLRPVELGGETIEALGL